MEHLYQQALAAMPVEDVEFILSHLPPAILEQPDTTSQACVPVLDPDPEEDEDGRRRRHIERDWPELSVKLSAEYYGQTYTAQIIPAKKKLKSGKQIVLLDGPAQGTVCDTLSQAMLVATEIQRNEQSLARKGVSNGWLFWNWPGKPENIAGDDADDD